MKKITEYQVVDHGIEHEQYFQGCGTAYTDYKYCQTGVGIDFKEALDDCLDQIAAIEDVDSADLDKIAETTGGDDEVECPDNDDDCSLWYYVSVRYNLA
jgi:hypothetical protein